MTLLAFVRGPLLEISLMILVFGTLWRLVALFSLHWGKNRSRPRGSRFGGGLRTVFSRFWPKDSFKGPVMTGMVLGFVAHIGLAIVVFGGVYHIIFIESLIGLGWPALPPVVITISAALSLGAFIGLLVRRLTNPVVRYLSNWDDYFSWVVSVLPLITGLLIGIDIGVRYEILLAIHILTAELLFIWIPFGKLFHTFTFVPSRAMTGATYGQRGVKA